MAIFTVSYDLHQSRDYKKLHEGLRENHAVKLLESLWLVDLSNTASQVRDWLQSLIDDDDSVAVLELKPGSGWATLRAKKEGTDWLKDKL